MHVYRHTGSIWKTDVEVILSDLLPYSLCRVSQSNPDLACVAVSITNFLWESRAPPSEARVIRDRLNISAFPRAQRTQIPVLLHKQSGCQPLSFPDSHCIYMSKTSCKHIFIGSYKFFFNILERWRGFCISIYFSSVIIQ